MDMEPSKAELGDMKTIKHAFTWAGITYEYETELAGALGIQPEEPLRVLAAIGEDDIN